LFYYLLRKWSCPQPSQAEPFQLIDFLVLLL
jgi:hypothetical protein